MTASTVDRAISRLACSNPQAAADLEFDLACVDLAYDMPEPWDAGETFYAKGEFQSALSDDQAIRCLRMKCAGEGWQNEFVTSLVRTHDGRGMSPKQRPWAHKLANEWLTKVRG